MTNQIDLIVNGLEHHLPSIRGETLSSLLRQRLHLTGTKIGCEEAECGACTVLVDGEPVLSCVYPSERADGKSILTIEGLASRVHEVMKLHPLQEAFVEYGAVQCGFCIPGQIMTAFALLKRNPNPTSADIRSALKDTLCRCAGYPSIESAIMAAAQALLTGESLKKPEIPVSKRSQKSIGQVHVRPDAVDKVTGKAIYTDDLVFDGMLFAAVRRAMIPHGFLRKLNISKALDLPGVKAVLTAKDIPGDHYHGLIDKDWPVLVDMGERIRYVGDAIALVAAETQEIADQAVDLIEVDFDLLPVITGPVQSRQEGAPQIHENGNLLKHIKVRKGNIEEGFSRADIILEHTFHTAITDHAFIEPECSIGVPLPNGRMEIYVGSQIPYQDRTQVAQVLGWPEKRVRILGQLIGGGFGGKEDVMGQIHVALLANATQRPVKLLFDRHESLLVHPKRHATQIRVKLGAKSDGQLVSVETELFGDTGAYASLGEHVMTRATTHSAGPYLVPNVRSDCYAMYTNNPPAGAFRGFGVTQSTFAVESMMDMLAEKLELDRVELRRINALRVGSSTNTGQELRESVGLLECIQRVDEEMRKHEKQPFIPRVNPNDPTLVRAWGFAVAYKNTGLGGGASDRSGAEVELFEDGKFEVRSSAAEMGQGLVSVMQLIVAEVMAVSPDQVRVLVMDTDLTPNGGPTTASRQTYVTGNASLHAARVLRDAITAVVAEKFDVPSDQVIFENGSVIAGGSVISFAEIAREMKTRGQLPRAIYEYEAPKTYSLGTLTSEGKYGDMHFTFSFSAQASEVEVNKQTGEVRVLRIISATDVGSSLNPLGLKGQVEGGIMMGIGNCLTEEFIVENGNIVTDYLARYRIPGIMHTPEITSIIVEHPTADGPYGGKGVGEIVSIPTTPAITNAIYNAVGVRVDSLPVDQEKILKGFNGL